MKTAPAKSARLMLLIATLFISASALLVIRLYSSSRGDQPPRHANANDRIRFYSRRIKTDPQDVKAYIELGKLEESQEFYISAVRRLTIARALGAEDKDLVLPLGRSLSHLARWDEARDELEKACGLMPDSVDAAANLAGVYYASGDARRASQVLTDFLARHRGPAGSLVLSIAELRRLMLCFSEAKDTRMAGEMAREILRQDPNDAGADSIAGHSLVVAGHYGEALPYLERAVAMEPDVATLCYNLGLALVHCNRQNEALRQFQRCVILNPRAADAFMELANLYEGRKEWKMSAAALSNVASQSRSNLKVLYRAGKANERVGNAPEADYWYSSAALLAGKYPEALGYAQKLAHSTDPNWKVSGLLFEADAYKGLHRMKEYLQTIKSVANRDTASDYMRLADAYEKCDLLDKQVEYLRRAMNFDPGRAPEIHSNIADTLLRRGLRDEAEQELQRAVAGDPRNAEYHARLGSLYLERRSTPARVEKAVAEFEQAVRIDPKAATGYQQLGIACAAANDLGHAAVYLEHAIDLEPGYGPSYEELGRVYARMGDRQSSDAMLALYRKYVRFDQTIKTLAAKADQNRRDAAAQAELADLLLRSGDYGPALDRYALALQLKPGDAKTRRKYDKVIELVTQSKAPYALKRQ